MICWADKYLQKKPPKMIWMMGQACGNDQRPIFRGQGEEEPLRLLGAAQKTAFGSRGKSILFMLMWLFSPQPQGKSAWWPRLGDWGMDYEGKLSSVPTPWHFPSDTFCEKIPRDA